MEKMVDKRSWDEFKNAGLLWWINRQLHLFGWALVYEIEYDGTVMSVYPARVRFRGFPKESENEMFPKLTKHIAENVKDLLHECEG